MVRKVFAFRGPKMVVFVTFLLTSAFGQDIISKHESVQTVPLFMLCLKMVSFVEFITTATEILAC